MWGGMKYKKGLKIWGLSFENGKYLCQEKVQKESWDSWAKLN